MTVLNNCPCCGAAQFNEFIKCRDYTVSQEIFTIVNCLNCSFKFTNPRPADSELGRYYKSEDYISHSNTRKGIVSRLYHLVRTYTLKQKLALISKYVSRGTIIDFGCGTGMFLKTCKSAGWNTIGMEPDAGARRIASGMGITTLENIHLLEANIGQGKAKAITLWHVLEHVNDLQQTLNFFSNTLDREGVLVIAVPNYTSYDALYYKECWAAYDVPRHLYHFEVGSISRLLEKSGFRLVESLPMKFDSFYVSMLSEKYKRGSISYLRAFLVGLKSNLRARAAKDYSSVIYVFKKK